MKFFHQGILLFLGLSLFTQPHSVLALKGRRASNITEMVVTFPRVPVERGPLVSPERPLSLFARVFGNINRGLRVHQGAGGHQRPEGHQGPGGQQGSGGRPFSLSTLFHRTPMPSPERRRRAYAKMKTKAG
uniref:Glycine rich superfamily member n=1 Tax=Rhipicephalus appendiculatus TaxID=34631 RepID=A0A131YCJ3_RHIAP